MDDVIDSLRAMRIKDAVLVTALVKLGGSITLTHGDVFDAAAHDVSVKPRVGGGFDVALVQSPKEVPHGR